MHRANAGEDRGKNERAIASGSDAMISIMKPGLNQSLFVSQNILAIVFALYSLLFIGVVAV